MRYASGDLTFAAVDGVSFNLGRGEALALIGESGCGKTSLGLALLRLLPANAQVSGRVELLDQEVLSLCEDELTGIRGRRIAMVFHDPLAALNPLLRIGTQIDECLRAHGSSGAAPQLLRAVGLEEGTARRFPHQLSGGMRQRALIAMAIAGEPQLLIADEPTGSLDPVNQVEILALLRELRQARGMALLLATHDLAFASRLCDRIAVLYAGRIVERGGAAELLAGPRHPYTAGLLRSLPPPLGSSRGVRLEPISGSPPRPWALPGGCRFRDRCPRARPDCALAEPELAEAGGREVACFHPLETAS